MASFEKFIIDVEILQMMSETLLPLKIDDAELAVDAIGEVGPGGHFFGSPHTLERYETAFYRPLVSDWRNFESWQEARISRRGRPRQPALETGPDEYAAPPLEENRAAELEDFVGRRKSEGGVG